MGALIENAKLIIDDLKSSWYFRLWSFFWVVCAVTVFASLIILGKRTTIDTEHKEAHVWFENATSITFPRFHIRVHDYWNQQTDGQIMAGKTCYHNSAIVPYKPCPAVGNNPVPPSNKCFSIWADTLDPATNTGGSYFNQDTIFECNITTTGSEFDTNSMLVWETEGVGISSYGGATHSVYIGANSDAWVLLDKEIAYIHGQGDTTFWNKNLVYRSSNSTAGLYIIKILIGTFEVPHFFIQDAYNPWMGVGDVGGFAFFTLILHTIVMMLLGICMENDSRFLKGDGGHRPL